MAHATAGTTNDVRTEHRSVEVVEPSPAPGAPLVPVLLVVLLAAVVIAAVLLFVAESDDPAAVDETSAGELEGAIHWRSESAAISFPAAVERGRATLLVGRDHRPDVDEPAELVALNLATGRELWRSRVPEPFVDAHGVTGEIAVATASLDQDSPIDVVAFDVRTGKELWRHTLVPGAPDPVVLEDAVLVGGDDLAALTPSTGRELWRRDVPVGRPPTVDEGIAYTVAPGQVTAVDVEGGEILWAHEVENVAEFTDPAVLHEDVVIAANRLGEVLAFERDSGRVVYEVLTDPADEPGDPLDQVDAGVVGLFGPTAGRVFAGTADGRVHAYDAGTGRLLWDHTTELDLSEPVVAPAGDVVVLGGDEDEDVVGIDASTGVERWRVDTGETIPPLVRDGLAYLLDGRAVDAAHDLVAVDAETGEEQWRVELDHPAFGAMVSTDGLLLVPTAERGAGTSVIVAVR